jgi:hypothetical protein
VYIVEKRSKSLVYGSKSGENFAKKGWHGQMPLHSLAAQLV